MALRLTPALFRLQRFSRHLTRQFTGTTTTLNTTATEPARETVGIPSPDGASKVYSPKIEQIFKSISELNLLEVAELSDVLKKRLNLPDAPVMSVASAPVAAAVAEEEEKEQVQTSFTVKLLSYDEKQKVALIKELKNLMPELNLVQAKKFIEGAPTIMKSDIGKEEAMKMKESLSKVGGEIVVD